MATVYATSVIVSVATESSPPFVLAGQLMNLFVKLRFVLVSLPLLLAGCNGPQPSTVAKSPTPTPTTSPSPAPATPQSQPDQSPATVASETEDRLISPRGIGAAQLGMTLGELKQKLGTEAEFTVESPFIVDFDAIAVRQAGEVQFYILYLAGQSFTDQDVIQGILTDNAKFRTAEDVGPGTLIADAEETYGNVTLSYNTDNESREYARFANQPAGNLSFSTGNGNASLAGIYASPTSDYNETEQFKPDAAIQSILVVCLTEDCVQTSPSS
ncbi:MAG: hypothetical protein EDM05_62260 [Leptolyngbya sp. IPPAS B-1204]